MGINNDHQDLEETLTADEDGILTDPIEARRDVIQKLKDNVYRSSTNRIAIRRREAFTDYSYAQRKKWFTEGAMLKINFVGEPSVDGGGPRREFFTGNVLIPFVIIIIILREIYNPSFPQTCLKKPPTPLGRYF
jgi:hypothetical protein